MQTSYGGVRLLFDGLSEHLRQYRASADVLFERKIRTAGETQHYLFALLLSATRVYLDFLLVLEALPSLYSSSDRKTKTKPVRSDASREMAYRERYTTSLSELPLHKFKPSGLAELTFKWVHEDYFSALCLHVPEIYEETLRLEAYLVRFQADVSEKDLTHFEIAFRHLSENHCTFLLPVLQDLVMEGNWWER